MSKELVGPVDDLGFEAPSAEELQPLFPAYEITEFVAQGGMGAVYGGRQKALDRSVAIKILPRQLGADEQFRANFEAEAKSMARLNHPNLIAVYDFGEAEGYLFIIMESVEGSSLHQAAHDQIVEQREAAGLVIGICRGLAHAQRNGILHRDIKPDNILLAPGPQPKIVDFGLARAMGEGDETGEAIHGTPGYSAPEVVKDPAGVDQRADIFSVGVMLYELLTGRMPSEPWVAPSVLVNCDQGFDNVVRRATRPSPGMRYADADEMANDLEKLVAKLSGPFALGGSAAAAPGGNAVHPVANGAAGIAPPVAPVKKVKIGAVVATAAVVVGLAAAVVWFVGKSRKDQSAQVGGGTPAAVQPDEVPLPPESDSREPVVVVPNDPPEPVPPIEPVEPMPPEPVAKAPETTLESLARLQPRLLNGNLAEMPKGTVRRGGSHYLLVEKRLDWDAASRFAERHGAQMVAFESAEDLSWAVGKFSLLEPVWLGLSDSGTEGKWFWVDGRGGDAALWAPGQPDNTVSGDDGEDFAVLLPRAILDDEPGLRERMFILQWAKSGGNPGSLETQLSRTGAALKTKKAPVFPAGARNIGGSRFLVVPLATSWEQASAAAKAVGGHLAVPSSDAEAAWISAAVHRVLERGESCWVGGRLTTGPEPTWAFVTGEKFEFVEWLPGRPDEPGAGHPCLQLHKPVDDPTRFGYADAGPSDEAASCYVIEWSAPSRRNMPGKDDKLQPKSVEDWLLAHQEATADEHHGDHEQFRKKWGKNVEDYVDEVEERASAGGRGPWAGRLSKWVEDYKAEIEKGGRIPETIPEFNRWWLEDTHGKAIEKQNEIWGDYEAKFNAALEAYLDTIRSMSEGLMSSGKRDDAAYLDREIEATTADHDRFHQILDGLAPPIPEG